MQTHRYSVWLFALVAGAALLVPFAAAQPMLINPALTNPPAEPAIPQPTVADKRAENSEQLRTAMRKLETNGAADKVTAQEVAYLQTREAVLAQQDAVEHQIKVLEARGVELENQLKSVPTSDQLLKFADLDRMKDELAAEEARASLIGDKLATAKANLQKAKSAIESVELKRREAHSAYENGKNSANVGDLAIAAERARQDAALTAETLTLRKREVDRDSLATDVLEKSVQVLKARVAHFTPLIAFNEADYNEQLEEIKKKESSATASLARAQANLHTTEYNLREVQQQIEAASGDRTLLTETLEAHQCTREKLTEEIDSLTQRVQKLAQFRLAWNARYEVATTDRGNTDHEMWAHFKSVQKESRQVLDTLDSDLRTQILKVRDVRSKLSGVLKKAEAAVKGPVETAYQIGIQQKQLEDTLKIYEKNLVMIETSRRLHEKLLDEIGITVESLTPQALALGAWYQVENVWKSELLKISDEPVRVGDAISGLSVLIIGWVLSRLTSGMFANRFLRRFRLSKDATSVIRSLVFYSLLMFVALTALKQIKVPLTAFTILGGALAVGVGFGSQTLINNFIGGLIMLVERPVRLGERIMFKEMDGVVEDVGFRCTKLRTPSDHLITIPNSTLVNESIENVDRRRTIRRSFTLTVTYNISRERLAEGIQAIRDIFDEREIREPIHPIVGFEELAPQVHFTDFAAESLNIQVVYWYSPVSSRAFQEHSERVNFRIMEEFDRLGIDFAFPSKTAFVPHPKRGGRGRGNDSYAA